MSDLKINNRGKLVEKKGLWKLLVENARRELRRQIDDEIFQALEDWASVNKEE